jgi:PASTA domain
MVDLGDIGGAISDFFTNLFSRIDPGEMVEGQGPGSIPRGRTTVPDVRGLNVDEARRTLGREGLRLEVRRLQERPAPVMGTVVDQDPDAGTRHRRAKPVMVFVQHLRDREPFDRDDG